MYRQRMALGALNDTPSYVQSLVFEQN